VSVKLAVWSSLLRSKVQDPFAYGDKTFITTTFQWPNGGYQTHKQFQFQVIERGTVLRG
jgi:hypothetical protein